MKSEMHGSGYSTNKSYFIIRDNFTILVQVRFNRSKIFMRKFLYLISLLFLFALGSNKVHAQYCDSLVPSFDVDLSAKADSIWISPAIFRSGLCCSSIAPEVCIEFKVTLSSNAVGVIFDVLGGGPVPGANFVYFNCSYPTTVGDTVFFPVAGPDTLTFCKPGNNFSQYILQSVPVTPLGLNNDESTEIIIYPNPADDYLIVESKNLRIESYNLSDISGKVIQTGNLSNDPKINLSGIPSGIYIMELISGTEMFRKKIILN